MVKTHVIRLRVIEGPNTRDQIALCACHSFLVEVQTNNNRERLGLRVLLNARNNNNNYNDNNDSEYLKTIKYPSVYKNTVVNGDLNMKVRINRVFGYEIGSLRRVLKSVPNTR